MRPILSFCQGFPETVFGPSEFLIAEGGREDILYILIEGKVEVVKGDLQVTTESEPGAIFGEMSVLLDIPQTANVKTLVSSRLYKVEEANAFLQSHPDITYQLSRLLAQRLYGASTYLADLKRQFAGQKDHFGMIDTVLETLVHQQDEECTLGSDRDPDPII